MIRINFTIPEDIALWFRAHCKSNGIKMSNLVSNHLQKLKYRNEAMEAVNGKADKGVLARGIEQGTDAESNRQS